MEGNREFRAKRKASTRENAGSSKIYTIFEGTSEIQRLLISRAISGIHID